MANGQAVLSRTADFLELAGSITVPAARRGTAWDDVLVRHLTGDPPEMAARATAYLATVAELLVADLMVAETVYVLESF